MTTLFLILASVALSFTLFWLYTLFLPDSKVIDESINETVNHMMNAARSLNNIKKENDKSLDCDLSRIADRISQGKNNKMIKGGTK